MRGESITRKAERADPQLSTNIYLASKTSEWLLEETFGLSLLTSRDLVWHGTAVCMRRVRRVQEANPRGFSREYTEQKWVQPFLSLQYEMKAIHSTTDGHLIATRWFRFKDKDSTYARTISLLDIFKIKHWI